MKEYKKSFLSADNSRLIYREWLPEQARGNLVIIHGAGEHSKRYQRTANYFAEKGFNVFVWDARGHGESEGKRGFVKQWSDFRDDIHYFFKAVRPRFAGLPVFLFGHSLGGLKTLDYVLNFPHEEIKGYICSSPAIGEVGVSPVLLTLARLVNHVMPSLGMDTGLDLRNISKDEDWLRETREDPLYHHTGTPRLAIEVQKTADWVQDNAQVLNYPILMIHGTDDTICHIDGSRRFYQNTRQDDKTLLEYPGGYHELLNDTERDKVYSDINQWIEQRL